VPLIDRLIALLDNSDRDIREDAAACVGVMVGLERLPPAAVPKNSLDLTQIQFAEDGNSVQTAVAFSEPVLRLLPTFSARLPASLRSHLQPPPIEKINDYNEIFRRLGISHVRLIRSAGRTLRYEGRTANGELRQVGIKLQNKNEPLDLLNREVLLLSWIERHSAALGLRSHYPIPFRDASGRAAILQIEDPGSESTAAAGSHRFMAIAYVAEPSYFDYLSNPEISESAYWSALNDGLHDLFALARMGLFHSALIDAFHVMHEPGAEGGRRYIWNYDHYTSFAGRLGAGRLEDFLGAVRYPNLRVSGLADLADVVTWPEIESGDHSLARFSRFAATVRGPAEFSKNFLVETYLGDYWFSAVMMAAPRLIREDEERKAAGRPRLWQDEARLETIADRLRRSYAVGAAAFLGISENEAWDQSADWGDYRRLARQMTFFMTDAYVPYFDSEEEPHLPPGIFPVEASFGPLKPEFWHPTQGYVWPKRNVLQRSLGQPNGPFLIQEAIRINIFAIMHMLHERAQPSARYALWWRHWIQSVMEWLTAAKKITLFGNPPFNSHPEKTAA